MLKRKTDDKVKHWFIDIFGLYRGIVLYFIYLCNYDSLFTVLCLLSSQMFVCHITVDYIRNEPKSTLHVLFIQIYL